ncbi:hypothetical protein FVEN_g11846 [Fusarium venenatum]|nr:hypothetical protein FVEN_g11846 [Fusarium venenatum]
MNHFDKDRTPGIFHPDFLTNYPDWEPLRDIYEASDRKCRLWIANPTIFKHAGGTLDWGTTAGHLIVRQIYKEMQVHRTMRTRQQLPDGSMHCPAINMQSSTIVVEETQHDEGQLRDDVESIGRAHARKLYFNPAKSALPDLERIGSSNRIGELHPEHKPRLNFGEHRKGVLTAFYYRNYKVLNPDEPILHGSIDQFKEAIKAIKDPNLMRTTDVLRRHWKREEFVFDSDIEDDDGVVTEDEECGSDDGTGPSKRKAEGDARDDKVKKQAI